jgi:glycosyltransferase involved in cell wall biosynthesis
MPQPLPIQVSVVIPTCNRKPRLLSLLKNLDASVYPVHEVCIIDSGEEVLTDRDYSVFSRLHIRYFRSEKSVCLQRNAGIQHAVSDRILLCDDDIELPADYIAKLVAHSIANPQAGAVSGLWLQLENGNRTAQYPENSARALVWKYVFQLGIWGEINCSSKNFLVKKIKRFYQKKGNHISKAGWPVLTEFSGDYFETPLYSLGAALVKKEWLLNSPFDEVLDRHGIGDNYGVASGFPGFIHVLNNVFVNHHREPGNRLQKPLQYYRRVLALDYFITTKKSWPGVKKRWLLWSLMGNLLYFIFSGRRYMIRAGWRAARKAFWNKNPYVQAAKAGKKIMEPGL